MILKGAAIQWGNINWRRKICHRLHNGLESSVCSFSFLVQCSTFGNVKYLTFYNLFRDKTRRNKVASREKKVAHSIVRPGTLTVGSSFSAVPLTPYITSQSAGQPSNGDLLLHLTYPLSSIPLQRGQSNHTFIMMIPKYLPFAVP